MADSALRRRLRDEQRPISYREAVRLGLRRPWTERQIAAARAVHDEPLLSFTRALPLLTGGKWLGERAGTKVATRDKYGTRLRAWAERVLAETAELNGEGA